MTVRSYHGQADGVRFRRATRSPLGAALCRSAWLGRAGVWGAQEEEFTSEVYLARLEFVNPFSTLLLKLKLEPKALLYIYSRCNDTDRG